jgi:hypothetical protein
MKPNIQIQQFLSVPSCNILTEYGLDQGKTSSNSRILIVDDEKFNCDIILGFLLLLGFENRMFRTTCVYDGEQAVNQI